MHANYEVTKADSTSWNQAVDITEDSCEVTVKVFGIIVLLTASSCVIAPSMWWFAFGFAVLVITATLRNKP